MQSAARLTVEMRNRLLLPALFSAVMLAYACCVPHAQEMPGAATPEPAPPELAPVRTIQFAGNTVVSDEDLREVTGIQPDQPLSPELLAGAIRHIEQAYAERGYAADFVYYEIQGEEPSRTLVFNIREVTISEVRITGLRRTREQTVRRFVDLEPADVYSQSAIEEAIARLDELGIFKEPQVLLQEGPKPGQVIVVFDLKEAKTRRIDLGGSYSPEGGLVGQVQYTQLNLFGRAQTLSASVSFATLGDRVGGFVAYFNPLVGRPQTTLFARVFSDLNFRFDENLVNEPDIGRYFERHTGAQAILSRPAGKAKRISYGLRYESTDIENLPLELLMPAIASSGGQIVVSSVRYVEDRRLFLVLPTSGNYLSAFVEAGQSSPDVGGVDTISKLRAEQRWYFPLERIEPESPTAENPSPVRTLAVRLSVGTSLGDLPFFEQFFVGGVTDLRGYRESRFWGKNFLTLNTELRWPFSRRLLGVAFVDVGDAWDTDFLLPGDVPTSFRQHPSFSPRAGAGVGIWWVTELGVVRLEYARGEANRLHFAIGESF